MHSTIYPFITLLLALERVGAASPFPALLPAHSRTNLSAAEQFSVQQDELCRVGMDVVYNSSCYAILKISQWLYFWQMRVTQCPNGTPVCKGCLSDKAWSTCFLRLALGTAGRDCTKINVKSCELEDFDLVDPNSIDMPVVRYIVRNIYAIDNPFTNWCK